MGRILEFSERVERHEELQRSLRRTGEGIE